MSPYRVLAARPACPRCAAPLADLRLFDATVKRCLGCDGVFVDRTLMARMDPLDLGGEVLDAFRPGQPAPERAVRYLRCPIGGELMRRRLVAGAMVIVDECPEHGVWFDAHELRVMVVRIEAAQAVGQSGHPPLRAPPSKNATVPTEPADDQATPGTVLAWLAAVITWIWTS